MLNTDIRNTNLAELTAVELRHYAGKLGVKGASKGRKADLTAALQVIQDEQIAERARQDAEAAAKLAAEREAELVAIEVESTPNAPATPKKGSCNVCGKRRAVKSINGQCEPCFEEGGWENTHNDAGHSEFDLGALTEEQAEEVHGCWICYPELNRAQVFRTGRSRAGMVIVAKGTEIHKSETFRVAAEAAGWTVEMMRETYELEADAEGEGTRYYATATRGTDSISLAWDGRAYDYPASSANLAGKGRKVRNLKEALRLI